MRDDVGVGHRSGTHGEIDALAHEVHDPLVEAQVHVDPGVACEELGQRRQQDVTPERAGHVDAHAARRLFLAAAQRFLRGGELDKYAPAMLEVIRPGGGQGDLACRAIEKLEPEPPLQAPDVGAHHRARQRQLIGSAGE